MTFPLLQETIDGRRKEATAMPVVGSMIRGERRGHDPQEIGAKLSVLATQLVNQSP
jgi:hypothetical protein